MSIACPLCGQHHDTTGCIYPATKVILTGPPLPMTLEERVAALEARVWALENPPRFTVTGAAPTTESQPEKVPPPGVKCPRCGYVTADVFACPTCAARAAGEHDPVFRSLAPESQGGVSGMDERWSRIRDIVEREAVREGWDPASSEVYRIATDAPKSAPSPHGQDVEGLVDELRRLRAENERLRLEQGVLEGVTITVTLEQMAEKLRRYLDLDVDDAQGRALMMTRLQKIETAIWIFRTEPDVVFDRYPGFGYHPTPETEADLKALGAKWSNAAALRSRVEPEPVAPAWQPIETAPKDGTPVLLASGLDVYAGFYFDSQAPHPWVLLDPPSMALNGMRDDKHGPTRWMPLPVAPREEKP